MTNDEWQPDRFKGYLEIITSALRYASPETSRILQECLMQLRLPLLELFVEPPKDKTVREELVKSGDVVIGGRTQHANSEFVQPVLFLSDLLNISETRATTLFQHATLSRARFLGWSPVRIAVYMYHAENEYRLECLAVLIRHFVQNSAPKENLVLIDSFLERLQTAAPSLAIRLLQAMDLLEGRLNSLREDVRMGIPSSVIEQLGVEDDVFEMNKSRTNAERIRVADIFCYTAARWGLTSSESVDLIKTLQKADVTDQATLSLLIAFMASINQSTNNNLAERTTRFHLSTEDYDVLTSEITGTQWRMKELQGTIWTQWICLISFTTSVQRRQSFVDEGFAAKAQRNRDQEQEKWKNEIGRHPAVYTFLVDYVISFQKKREEQFRVPVLVAGGDEDIRKMYWRNVERLTDMLIVYLRRALKDIKNHDEDTTRAAEDQNERARYLSASSRRAPVPEPIVVPQTAWEAVLALITLLYRDQPDAALSFWSELETEHSLPPETRIETLEKQSFVKMASDVTTPRFLEAFLHMLASLATGSESAEEVHLRLHTDPGHSQLGRVVWGTFFKSLRDVTDFLSRGNAELKSDELGLVTGVLRLIRQVVKYSLTAKRCLCDNPQYRALHTLFMLLVNRIPVELKGNLFETIAAFCLPFDKSYDLQRQVWDMLEQSQIVGTREASNKHSLAKSFGGVMSVGSKSETPQGILYDLEETETILRSYPETIGFLHLLNVLLEGTSAQLDYALKALGHDDRIPGLRPYVKFVMDNVFLKVHLRAFSDEAQKWEMLATCLHIFEKSTNHFDLTVLLSGDGSQDAIGRATIPTVSPGFHHHLLRKTETLVLQPGFDVYYRLLSNSPFTETLFSVLSIEVDDLNSGGPARTFKGNAVLLSLKILLRVFQNQRTFLEVLIPALVEAGLASALGITPSVESVDEIFSYHKGVVIVIAKLLACIDDEISLLAVKLLTIISQSHLFGGIDLHGRVNRLVSLLQSSTERDVIIAGFVKRLEMEEDETLDVGEFSGDATETAFLESNALSSTMRQLLLERREAAPWPVPKSGLVHGVRMTILHLLLVNITQVRPAPTIAHFLLGFNIDKPLAQTVFPLPSAPNARYTCLQAIANRLQVSDFDKGGKSPTAVGDDSLFAEPLFLTHPRFASRCYQLLYELCADPQTSGPSMRYLRNQKDYFFQQVKALPVSEVYAGDVDNDNQTIVAHLMHRTWVMKSVALELHVTTSAHKSRLIDLLYVAPVRTTLPTRTTGWENEDELDEEDFDEPFVAGMDTQHFEQPLTKILEILNSLNFEEPPETGSPHISDGLLRNVDFEQFRKDGLFDIRAIYRYYQAQLLECDTQEELSSLTVKEVLSQLVDINFAQELGGARLLCAQAWGEIVQTTLLGCFTRVPAEVREARVFELLSALLPKVNAERISIAIAEAMSMVILILLTKMNNDKLFQCLLQTGTLQATSAISTLRLPMDTLQQVVLRGILDAILMPGASLAMRGNLYVALMRLLDYTKPEEPLDDEGCRDEFDCAHTTGNLFVDSNTSRLFEGNYAILTAYSERLYPLIARDAGESTDVWSIVAFAVLIAIDELSSLGVDHGSDRRAELLNMLGHRNALTHFIKSLKLENNRNLSGLMTKSPEAYTVRLFYEIKMSFFQRIATYKQGALKLMDYGMLETLADCRFLDHRPQGEVDISGSLTVLAEQYHRMLVPTLRLVLLIARQVGNDYNAPVKVKRFVMAHGHILLGILNDANSLITIPFMKEIELVTALFAYLVEHNSEPKFTYSTPSNTLPALFSKYAVSSRWLPHFKASDGSEWEVGGRPMVADPSAVDGNKVRQEAERLASNICRNVVQYWLSTTSHLLVSGARTAEPVLLPLIPHESNDRSRAKTLTSGINSNSCFNDDPVSNFETTAPPRPSVGLIFGFTNKMMQTLLQALDSFTSAASRASDIQRLTIHDMHEISKTSCIFEEELSPAQLRQWVFLVLAQERRRTAEEIRASLCVVEQLLLLIWRHLAFFLHKETSLSDSMQEPLQLKSSEERENFRAQARNALMPVLSPLTGLTVPTNIVKNWRNRRRYVQALLMKLEDVLQPQQDFVK
ncbi:nucleoporin Nup186/Nup192/Nup205 [Gaertneriomyces semiglobifer]|nr:nucleoporin Nup186/Nup192/Nup205 [Gaertneriomyces semiglobifer]